MLYDVKIDREIKLMTKRFALVLLVVVGVGATWTYFYFGTGVAESGPTFTLAQVTQGNVIDTVETTGTLQAVTTVQVGTQVSGAIKALHADFNTNVRRGQIIAELEPSLFETQVEQARATLVRQEAELERAKVQVEDTALKLTRSQDLSEQGLIQDAELETAQINARLAQSALRAAEAQMTQVRASLNQSEVSLGHTIIRAPIDGIVISRSVDVGQTVAASMNAPTLYVLAQDLAEMQVNANVDESDIGRIQPGQSVTFRVDAHPDETFTGTVSQVRLEPVVTQNVVSYVTIINVPNPALILKPGMTAMVTVEIARANNVLRIPNGALRYNPSPEVFAALGQPVPGGREIAGFEPQAVVQRDPVVDAKSAIEVVEVQQSGELNASLEDAPFFPSQMGPQQREQMRARIKQMSVDERQRLRQQFQQARRDGRPRMPGLTQQQRSASQSSTGSTLWGVADGQLSRVMVQTGISDGSYTSILDGAVVAGVQVATGVRSTEVSTGSGLSPFMPFGRRSSRGSSNRGRGGPPR